MLAESPNSLELSRFSLPPLFMADAHPINRTRLNEWSFVYG
jgi:hypothetical protein